MESVTFHLKSLDDEYFTFMYFYIYNLLTQLPSCQETLGIEILNRLAYLT